MLPTKLASAALRGMRSAAVPPEAVVVLMRSLLGVPAATAGRAGGGRPGESGAVSVAVLRAAPGVPGRPARPTLPGGASLSAAYVPIGYVPDGEVTAVTCQVEVSAAGNRDAQRDDGTLRAPEGAVRTPLPEPRTVRHQRV